MVNFEVFHQIISVKNKLYFLSSIMGMFKSTYYFSRLFFGQISLFSDVNDHFLGGFNPFHEINLFLRRLKNKTILNQLHKSPVYS